MLESLAGKTVIITGTNAGIGKVTALDMATRGARVIMACRDKSRGESAAEEVRRESHNDNVVMDILDLASLESVREFAALINEREERLDILINNAGARINFDDLNSEKSYSRIGAYRQSKLANVLFTRILHQKLEGTGVTTYSLHPGVIRTNLIHHLRESTCGCLIKCCSPCTFCCLKTPKEGAKTTIYCAVAPGIEEHSGKYFSGCRLARTGPEAENDEVARRLWEVSEELTSASQ